MHPLIKRAPTRRFFCVVSSFDRAIHSHAKNIPVATMLFAMACIVQDDASRITETFGPCDCVDDGSAARVSRPSKCRMCACRRGGLLRRELSATRDAQCDGNEVLCVFSAPVQFFQNYCETNFFSGSGNDRASKLAFSVLRSADRTNKIICQVVANSTSIRSSLLSPTLTSSNIAFGQPKVSSLIPIKGNRGHGDAGITVGTNVQLGAVRYPMGGGK
jgi:hypothetical protein